MVIGLHSVTPFSSNGFYLSVTYIPRRLEFINPSSYSCSLGSGHYPHILYSEWCEKFPRHRLSELQTTILVTGTCTYKIFTLQVSTE